jgi:hypothetical protein
MGLWIPPSGSSLVVPRALSGGQGEQDSGSFSVGGRRLQVEGLFMTNKPHI